MNKALPKSMLIGRLLLFISLLSVSGCNDDDQVQPAPEVISISPESGAKGTEVVITGTNFSATPSHNQVTFNNVPAEISSASATRLTVKVPAGAGSGEVAVTSNGKTANDKPIFGYEWLVTTVAGSVEGYEDGPADQAKFSGVQGIAVDDLGDLYVADATANAHIRKIASGVVSTLAGSILGFKDGTGAEAQFWGPRGIAIDVQGNLYVADAANYRIRKVSPEGVVTTLAGSTKGYEDNVGTLAKFGLVKGICVDGEGNVYVTDETFYNIRKVAPDGTVTTIAGNGQGFADGAASMAKFEYPGGIAVDPDGNLYVADAHRVRKISRDGMVTTVAGTVSGYADGPVSDAKLGGVTGLCLDAEGNIYIADYGNHRIRMIGTDGMVSTLAGSTQLGMASGSADGSALQAQFTYPYEITIDAAGNLYVTDLGNAKIRKIEY